eukprot:7214196-Karenia_brevis.AAC.1
MGYKNDWGRHNSPYGDAKGLGNGKGNEKGGCQNYGGKGFRYVPPRPKFGGVPYNANYGDPSHGSSSYGCTYATGGGVVEPPKCTPGITNYGSNANNGPSPSGSN